MEKRKIIIAVAMIAALALLIFLLKKKQATASSFIFQAPVLPVSTPKKSATTLKASSTVAKSQASIPTLLNPSTSSTPSIFSIPQQSGQPPKVTAVNYAKAFRKYAMAGKGKLYDSEVSNLVKEASSKGIRFADIAAAYYNTYKGGLTAHLSGKITPQCLTYLTTLS